MFSYQQVDSEWTGYSYG